jgi:membrane dipeptidase
MAQDEMTRARNLSAEAIGIDSHIDTIQPVLVMGGDLGTRWEAGPVEVPRRREGGMRAPFFAFWVPVNYQGAEAACRTLDLRDAMQSVLDAHPDQIELATTPADIERIVRSGKISAFLTIEGGRQIDDDLRVPRMYYQLGMRSMTLTHSRNNNWANASMDEPAHNGLTGFGKEVAREMNRPAHLRCANTSDAVSNRGWQVDKSPATSKLRRRIDTAPAWKSAGQSRITNSTSVNGRRPVCHS